MERALCRCAIAAGYRYRFIRRIVRIVPVPTMSSSTEPAPMTKVLIFGGKTGWIGGLMAELVNKKEGTCTYMYMYVALCPTLAMYPEDVCL